MPGLEHPLPVLGLAAGCDGDDRDARRPAAASRRRISRAVAGPSSRGIMPSTSRRSNGSAARRSSASAPLATVTTSRPRAASWLRAIRR